ncbi:MAG: RDD family protein [Gammaproteobacteria bacterium]|nr:RDD family protein [Gammaproteobacteria bacterium]
MTAAGPLRRLAALGYDMLLATALLMGATALYVAAVVGFTDLKGAIPAGSPYSQGLRVFLLCALFAYFAGFWVRAGYTPGMRAWRLKMVRFDKTPLIWRDALARVCFALISAIPLGLGFLWAFKDAQKLTWHDRLSRTVIIMDPDP